MLNTTQIMRQCMCGNALLIIQNVLVPWDFETIMQNQSREVPGKL